MAGRMADYCNPVHISLSTMVENAWSSAWEIELEAQDIVNSTASQSQIAVRAFQITY